VPRTETETKERKHWHGIRAMGAAVVAVPLLLVAVIADAAVFARIEEDGDGFR
jgi:hypothetical protein